MSFDAKILKDSISPDGVRLTTFEVTFPRIVLAEFNTHRQFSRNSASSRAIPVEKMLQRVREDPYIPSSWGKNQKGMQAGEELDQNTRWQAEERWRMARDAAVVNARMLLDLGVHKQLTNRLLEPFMWHTVIVTATEWSNFFHLRNNPLAHPEIQIPARMMQELYEKSETKLLGYGAWHLPLVPEFDEGDGRVDNSIDWRKVSVARCARVSYLTHDGKRDVEADLTMHDDRLLAPGHMSPFEHVARPMNPRELELYRRWDCLLEDNTRALVECDTRPMLFDNKRVVHAQLGAFCGNFNGWVQYRKLIPNEHDILGR